MVGSRTPCRAQISAGWRPKGISWNGGVLGEEEEQPPAEESEVGGPQRVSPYL